MKRLALLTCALAACGELPNTLPPLSGPAATSEPPVTASCDAGDRAFLQRATLALAGRRPYGQAELSVGVVAITQIRAARGNPDDLAGARRVVARTLMEDAGYTPRWADFFKDALRVARTQTKSLEACYGESDSPPSASTILATYVRDHEPSDTAPPVPGFTLAELLPSALALDDLSVLYRANLLAMMSRPFVGNSSGLELELARRNDFGTLFEAAYTSRDVLCLGCHNSARSVTASSDPERNRFWPAPGLFELALFGASSGEHPAAEAATKGSDALRARGMFRVTGVTDDGQAPFGWSPRCGTLRTPVDDDPLGIDTYFGTLRSSEETPLLGRRASVLELERSLHRGVDALASHGLTRLADGTLPNPDEAFAYLVALTIVEKVWAELVGTTLTVAHHFPRTQVQRDVLVSLTNAFVATHFSLKGLLLTIVTEPTFNLRSPRAACDAGPYPLARLFDPWTDGENDVLARGNGPSDVVHAVSPRVLRRALHVALGWAPFPEYPAADGDEEQTQAALGFFLRDAAPGHRGLDFQGRLVWEARYGACPNPGGEDYISKLVSEAAATPGATLGDAVSALKDRLLAQPAIAGPEQALLEALLGAPLASTDFGAADARLRRVCGALAASPAFLLDGVVPEAAAATTLPPLPSITPYAAACRTLAERLRAIGAAETLDCDQPDSATSAAN